jgi:beta-xylosidase
MSYRASPVLRGAAYYECSRRARSRGICAWRRYRAEGACSNQDRWPRVSEHDEIHTCGMVRPRKRWSGSPLHYTEEGTQPRVRYSGQVEWSSGTQTISRLNSYELRRDVLRSIH